LRRRRGTAAADREDSERGENSEEAHAPIEPFHARGVKGALDYLP
jgi:hypothetical protein